MIKKMTRTAAGVTLELDERLLEAASLNPDMPVELSTEAGAIVITQPDESARRAKLARGSEVMHGKFAGAFKRLAN